MNIKKENKELIIEKENKQPKNEISNNNEIDNLKRKIKNEEKKSKNSQNTINQSKQEHNIEFEKYKNDMNKPIEEQLLDEKNKNKKLQDTIDNLNNTINQLEKKHSIDIEKFKSDMNRQKEINKELEKLFDEKNKKLQDTIDNLNNTINQLKQEHNNDIEKYLNDMNKLAEKNKELEKLLAIKNKEIDDYIFKLSSYGVDEKLISFNPGDKIMVVLFVTQGNQDIFNYGLACKSSDLFIRLEERLYHDFPKYRNYETFYMVNTRKIFRFKTLEENQIKNNDIISLFIIE